MVQFKLYSIFKNDYTIDININIGYQYVPM